MAAVDTNVLVRLLTEDDPSQLVAAREYITRGVWISQVVLAETSWVLRSGYRFTHEEIVSSIEELLIDPRIAVEDAETVASALSLYRTRPSLGFSDCLVLEIARKAGHLPLATFDRHLGRLAGAQRL